MLIEAYSFGRMVVEDETYENDLMICGEDLKSNWVRKEGHRLFPEDLTWVLEAQPDLLVVGTGSSGRMRVPEKTRQSLQDNGISLWVGRTDQAVDRYNEEVQGDDSGSVAAAFHLTC